MGDPYEAIGGLMVTMVSSVVLGCAILFLVYMIVDGDLPIIPGICAIGMAIIMLSMCVKPPHPAVPAVVLVTAITLMAFYPWATDQMVKAELKGIDIERLERSFLALQMRPDNYAAMFEIAKGLHAFGYPAQAVALAGGALNGLSTAVDPLKNRSLRDQFRNEEIMVKGWQRKLAADPAAVRPVACPTCGAMNPVETILCVNCGKSYLLDLARSTDFRGQVIPRLIVAWVFLALLITGSAAIGLYLSGVMLFVALFAALFGAFLILRQLFRPLLTV